MNLLKFVVFFLLLVSVFSVGKPEIWSADSDTEGDSSQVIETDIQFADTKTDIQPALTLPYISSSVIETDIQPADTKTDIQPDLTLEDIWACEKNIIDYKIASTERYLKFPPGCSVSSQDPRYLKNLANYLAFTFRLDKCIFCKRSFNFGNTNITKLQAIYGVSLKDDCPIGMDFVL